MRLTDGTYRMGLKEAMHFEGGRSRAADATDPLPVFLEKLKKPGGRVKCLISGYRHSLRKKASHASQSPFSRI